MKHADADTLARLSYLLDGVRQHAALTEKSPGIFYMRALPFLHFHDDPSGIFADVKLDFGSYSRHRVSTRREQKALLGRIVRCLNRRG